MFLFVFVFNFQFLILILIFFNKKEGEDVGEKRGKILQSQKIRGGNTWRERIIWLRGKRGRRVD